MDGRRSFLRVVGAAGLATLAGCTSVRQALDDIDIDAHKIKDSDGDGVINTADYAPWDESVQAKSDLTTDTSPTTPTASSPDPSTTTATPPSTGDRFSFERADPGAPVPTGEWYVMADAGPHRITTQRATHGRQSLHMRGASGLGETRLAIDLNFTPIQTIRFDGYPVRNTTTAGDIKLHVDDTDFTIAGITQADTDKWHRDLTGTVADLTGRHTLIVRTRGDGNEAFFDNIRLLDASGTLIPPSTVTEPTTRTPPPADRGWEDTFASGKQGWTFGKRRDERAARGTATWSEKYDGSLQLHVDGAPSTIQAWKQVGPLQEGTTITAQYAPTQFATAASIQLKAVVPNEQVITLDVDNDPNKRGPRDGHLTGTLPTDLPATTQIELKLVIWPGETTVWIKRVAATPS